MERHSLDSYQVGILCALPLEKAAVEAALDEEHERPMGIPQKDEHSYTFGRIGAHHVVIACLPDGMTGKASAATLGTDVSRTFPIKVGLMVGIGGGAPSKNNDIRLGDIVVGRPQGTHGGVVQYDFGKELPNGFMRTGMLNKPPTALLSALAGLRTKHERPRWNKVSDHMAKVIEEMGDRYDFQGVENDVLFESAYEHIGGPEASCDDHEASEHCDLNRIIHRPDRKDPTRPVIHYGTIASADKVMRHAPERDRIAKELNALCFEMEAAGLEENFRCIVIRGICDYSDSHKNKRWQRYAAVTAAAFAKEFLSFVLPRGLDELGPVGESRKDCLQKETATAEGAPRPVKSVPYSSKGMPVIDDFVPRDEEMDQLESYFFSTESPIDIAQKVFVLHGMGGIGKTQLCLEFVRQSKSRFDSIFWLDGSSKASLQQSLAKAASKVFGVLARRDFTVAKSTDLPSRSVEANLFKMTGQFLSWLSQQGNESWLLVFDNVDRDWTDVADDHAYDITRFLPNCDHGNILVTTRLSHLLSSVVPVKRLLLDKVNDEQARQILEMRAGKALPGRWSLSRLFPVLTYAPGAQALIDRLKGLPLALAQAGCYLQKPITVEKYLEMYESTWARLMQSQQQFEHGEHAARSLLTTWVLSYEQVVRESPEAAGVLRLWAYLDSTDLWFDLVFVPSDTISELRWPAWYTSLIHDELTFHDHMNVLLAYSLAGISSTGQGYSIHRVVHDWTRHQIGDHIERGELYRMTIHLVGNHCHDTDPDHDRRLLPHARHQASRIQPGCDQRDIQSLHSIAKLLDECGECALGAKLYEHVLAVCQTTLGPDHESTLWAAIMTGDAFSKSGHKAEASFFYCRASDGYRAVHGTRNAHFLDTSHRWAVLLRDMGRFDRARALFEESLEGYKELYGIDHEKTYHTAFDMATTCYVDKPAEALRLVTLSLQGKTNSLGPSHWMTLETVYHLGWHYHSQGLERLAQDSWQDVLARPIVDEAMRGWLETKYTIPTLWEVSTIYLREGRYDDAATCLARVERAVVFHYGTKHSTTIWPRKLLIRIYIHQAKWSDAEETMLSLLEYFEFIDLARVQLRMGKLADASQSCKRSTAASASDKVARHIQASIDYLRSNFISEIELRSVLSSLDFPLHSDKSIERGIQDYLAQRAESQKDRRISYRSKIPVPKSKDSGPLPHSPSQTDRSAGLRQPSVSRTSTPEAASSRCETKQSPTMSYCESSGEDCCTMPNSDLDHDSAARLLGDLDFYRQWIRQLVPELQPPPPYVSRSRSPARSSTPSHSRSHSGVDQIRGRSRSSQGSSRGDKSERDSISTRRSLAHSERSASTGTSAERGRTRSRLGRPPAKPPFRARSESMGSSSQSRSASWASGREDIVHHTRAQTSKHENSSN